MDIIRQMVYNMNCSHHLWVNKRADHAYFVEHDFEVERHPFRPHPDPSEPIPGKQWLAGGVPRYWMFQVACPDSQACLPSACGGFWHVSAGALPVEVSERLAAGWLQAAESLQHSLPILASDAWP